MCAIIIQSNIRRYLVQRIYFTELLNRKKAKVLIRGLVKGWKIRKIFKTKFIKEKKKQILDLKEFMIEIQQDEKQDNFRI
jgi:hypothetical protein